MGQEIDGVNPSTPPRRTTNSVPNSKYKAPSELLSADGTRDTFTGRKPGSVEVQFDRAGKSLYSKETGQFFNVRKDGNWYESSDRDGRYPYRLSSEKPALSISVLEPVNEPLPVRRGVDNILDDPTLGNVVRNLSPGKTIITRGYEFTKVGRDIYYSRVGDNEWRSLDSSDTNTYKLIRDRNRVNVSGIERVTDGLTPPRVIYNPSQGGPTSRYEASLNSMISSTDYPRQGHTSFVNGKKYFYSSDRRVFVQEDGSYYQVNNGKVDRSLSYTHFQHGDKRIQNYLLPKDGVPFPRSIAQDFAPLYQAKGNPNALGSIELPPDGGRIVIPTELRKPGEDGIVVLNIGSKKQGNRGITTFDNENYGPGHPSYLNWNHATAPDMLKDAGIVVTPVFYSDGKRLRYLKVEFLKPGVFEINGKKITVTNDGVKKS